MRIIHQKTYADNKSIVWCGTNSIAIHLQKVISVEATFGSQNSVWIDGAIHFHWWRRCELMEEINNLIDGCNWCKNCFKIIKIVRIMRETRSISIKHDIVIITSQPDIFCVTHHVTCKILAHKSTNNTKGLWHKVSCTQHSLSKECLLSANYHPMSRFWRYSNTAFTSPSVKIFPSCSDVSIFKSLIPLFMISSQNQIVLIA